MTAVNGTPPGKDPSWEEVACPILTLGSMMAPKPPPSSIVGAVVQQQQPPDPIGCLGPHCAMFVAIKDETGKLIGGKCAFALGPSVGNQQALATMQLVKVMSGGTVAKT